MLSTSDELSPAWVLTLTESDCTVVLQQKCDIATLIIFIFYYYYYYYYSSNATIATQLLKRLPIELGQLQMDKSAAETSKLTAFSRLTL